MRSLRLLLSASPWRSTAYLISYLVAGPALFAVTVTAVVVSCVLCVTWLGVPLLVAAAGVVRGCATMERLRTGIVAEPVVGTYQVVTESGLFSQIRTRWRDHTTRRDCAYLVVMFVPLMVLDLVVLVLWLSFLCLAATPLWYWAGPDLGHTIFYIRIDSLGSALAAAVLGLVLTLFGAHLVTWTARLHAHVARSLLGPWTDPLAEAKRMLAAPGPLSRV